MTQHSMGRQQQQQRRRYRLPLTILIDFSLLILAFGFVDASSLSTNVGKAKTTTWNHCWWVKDASEKDSSSASLSSMSLRQRRNHQKQVSIHDGNIFSDFTSTDQRRRRRSKHNISAIHTKNGRSSSCGGGGVFGEHHMKLPSSSNISCKVRNNHHHPVLSSIGVGVISHASCRIGLFRKLLVKQQQINQQELSNHIIHKSHVNFNSRRGMNYEQPQRNAVVALAGWKSREKGKEKVEVPATDAETVPKVGLTEMMMESPEDMELTLLGKTVAGIVDVTVTIGMEFATGFFLGYFVGTVTDVPRLLFRSSTMDPTIKLPIMKEFVRRTTRMHGKSYRWAKSFGGINAIFGGSRSFVRVVRDGREDEWNTILSTTFAGAYFQRAAGPRAMLQSALLYGGLSYMLSSNGAGGKRGRKKEQALNFDDEEMSMDDEEIVE